MNICSPKLGVLSFIKEKEEKMTNRRRKKKRRRKERIAIRDFDLCYTGFA
jgi:hypothetical protein